MPLAVYLALQTDPERRDRAVSLVLLVVSVGGAGSGCATAGWSRPARDRPSPACARTGRRPRPGSTASSAGATSTLDAAALSAAPARCWACSARTAPARRPCCARWPACRARRRAGSRLGRHGARRSGGRRLRPARAAARSALVFQDYRLFPHLSVLRQRRVRRPARAARPPAAARARPDRGSTGSAWPAWPAASRPSCPAARPSGSPWPARWPPSRRCCCWTSRSPRWTPDPARGARASCGEHLAASPAGRCWSPTTRSRRWCWPTGCVVVEDGRVVQEGTPAEVARPAGHRVRRAAGRAEPVRRPARAGRTRWSWTDGGTLVVPMPSESGEDVAGQDVTRAGRRVLVALRPSSDRAARRSGRASPACATSGRARSPAWSCWPTGCGCRSTASPARWWT